MNSIVLIPIYKEKPDSDEILSLQQCFKVLAFYDICLVCPESLDTTIYNNIVKKEIKTERFASTFFAGIAGYNELMTSMQFYNRFKKYDYMLIYQLDAWVFSDELEEWCRKGYDYIGAPWFEQHKTHEEGYGFWCCGNGGLSLRKISTFIRVTNPKTRLMTLKEIANKYFRHLKTWRKGIELLLYKNNMKWYRKKNSHLWEDTYFCYGLDETKHKLHRPLPEEAARFSFECSPEYLFQFIGRTLPFGCHAWRKFQYEEFWSKYIH